MLWDNFLSFSVVTGATDGIGKAYAEQVNTWNSSLNHKVGKKPVNMSISRAGG